MAPNISVSWVDVSATLEALKHTLGHFDVVQDEEPKILDG